jgi:hypothetical protein
MSDCRRQIGSKTVVSSGGLGVCGDTAALNPSSVPPMAAAAETAGDSVLLSLGTRRSRLTARLHDEEAGELGGRAGRRPGPPRRPQAAAAGTRDAGSGALHGRRPGHRPGGPASREARAGGGDTPSPVVHPSSDLDESLPRNQALRPARATTTPTDRWSRPARPQDDAGTADNEGGNSPKRPMRGRGAPSGIPEHVGPG